MKLKLHFDEAYCEGDAIKHLERRLYATRNFIPEGFEELFRRRALYVNAYTTTAIEGNPLRAEEGMRVSVEGPNRERPNEVEIANIEEAYELIYQVGPDPSIGVDQGLIRTLHSIVLKGLPDRAARNRGRYRLGPAGVALPGSREVVYLPPSAQSVPELMSGLVGDIADWRQQFPAAVVAALVHFGIVSIHPFEDGNGRTARLVAHMLLSGAGDVAALLTVNDAIWVRRSEYYRVLGETQDPDFRQDLDVTPFVQFHTDALISAANSLEDEAVEFSRLRDEFVRSFGGAITERQTLGLLFLLLVGRPISSAAYMKFTGASQATASRDLKEMVRQEMLVRAGAGRSTRYEPHPNLLAAASTGDTDSTRGD